MTIFDRKDYLGWLAGALVLGGLIVNPWLYVFFRKMGYLDALIPSLAVSFVVAISATRSGSFSWLRVIVATAIVLGARHFFYTKNGVDIETGGGFLMFLTTFACAFAGVKGHRARREIRELGKDPSKRQHKDPLSGEKSETHTDAQQDASADADKPRR